MDRHGQAAAGGSSCVLPLESDFGRLAYDIIFVIIRKGMEHIISVLLLYFMLTLKVQKRQASKKQFLSQVSYVAPCLI